MLKVIQFGDVFTLELVCDVCDHPCRLDRLMLAWPAIKRVDGVDALWLCDRRCADGQVQALFGTSRVVMMHGATALTTMAQSLHSRSEDALVPAGGRARMRRGHP
jgi:hypothetical protein